MQQWNASHSLDPAVPAGNAYLPHVSNGVDEQSDTWQVVNFGGGGDRVNSYTLNVPPTSLAAAVARARQELPADATLLWSGTVTGVTGSCYEAEWQSPTLASVLGGGYVNVEFDNAPTGASTPITEGIFGDQAAPTMAQAPAC